MFLLTLEKRVDILYVDEGPRELVAVADSFDPGSLCGETCGAMEVADLRLNAGELIHIVDGLH